MKRIAKAGRSKRVRRLAAVVVAGALVAGTQARAATPDTLTLLPPGKLPELARRPGEALLLHDAGDGRTLLYVEQAQGSGLVVLDVTNPAHVTALADVALGAPGAFDFDSSLGLEAEVVRFRHGEASAVLNLRRPTAPALEKIEGELWAGTTLLLGGERVSLPAPANAALQPTAAWQRVELPAGGDGVALPQGRQIRAAVSNAATGTDFLLTDEGLYVLRRPHAEARKQLRDRERAQDYAPG